MRINDILRERQEKLYDVLKRPLPSFDSHSGRSRRSLATDPVARATPSSLALLDSVGVAPSRATRAGALSSQQHVSGIFGKRVARESERQEEIVGDFSLVLNRSDRTREAAPLRERALSESNDASDVGGKNNETS